jgi:transposase-like protein
MVSSKKGISALQIHRMIDPVRGRKGSYKTAWYMCHRLRAAMKDGSMFNPPKLTGEVEVDETYVGGKARNRHGGRLPGKRAKGIGGSGTKDKVAVVGAIARKGNVICQVIERVSEEALTGFVAATVSTDVSLIATDEHRGYKPLKTVYPHETVNHSSGEYVRGNVHTANLDNFWSMLKRGIVGTFHKVSKDHLPLYLNEFSWRYNHRHDPEIFKAVLAGC